MFRPLLPSSGRCSTSKKTTISSYAIDLQWASSYFFKWLKKYYNVNHNNYYFIVLCTVLFILFKPSSICILTVPLHICIINIHYCICFAECLFENRRIRPQGTVGLLYVCILFYPIIAQLLDYTWWLVLLHRMRSLWILFWDYGFEFYCCVSLNIPHFCFLFRITYLYIHDVW